MMVAEKLSNTKDLAFLLADDFSADCFTDINKDVSDLAIHGLSLDSRAIEAGDLFIALGGEKSCGLDFSADVEARGATVIAWDATNSRCQSVAKSVEKKVHIPLVAVADLAEKTGEISARFYAQPSRFMRVIGVTGTDGKTSVSHIIAQALSEPDLPCGFIGTIGVGALGDLRTATHTTPNAITLQKHLSEFSAQKYTSVVMEVSSHALDQGRVNGVVFDTAVFTNLGRDHLDYHQDLESYAAAKKKLFALPELKRAVINIDDDYGENIISGLPEGVAHMTYGFSLAADVCVREITQTKKGLDIHVQTPAGTALLHSPLIGDFNVSNLLAALAVLLISGVALDTAVLQLKKVRCIPGRMEKIQEKNPRAPMVVIDFAHTPQALTAALAALRPRANANLWCVFGCGGDRDRGKRPEMAVAAESFADHVVVTNDNPRTESPGMIIEEICAGFKTPEKVEIIHDRKAAIAFAIGHANHDDVILVAGKGHEKFQLMANEKMAFDDCLVAKELLEQLTS